MREKGILKHLSSGNGPHAWRCNLAAHLLESSDQNFLRSLNWLQSKHRWWHRHCTQCNFSNYPRGTEMKKAVMGITNALLAQNMGKSCDQMNFYRSRVQWLRDTALEELFPRAALVNEKMLTQPCVMFLLEVLGHHFLVQFSNSLCTEKERNGAFPTWEPCSARRSRRSRQSTGNTCWGVPLVQGAGKVPQHFGVAVCCTYSDWLRH